MKRTQFRGVLLTMVMFMFVSTMVSVMGDSTKINLNKADAAELSILPGVGTVLAHRIVTFRQENGPFDRVEDLLNVQGIGEKNFLKIREQITVEDRDKDRPGGE